MGRRCRWATAGIGGSRVNPFWTLVQGLQGPAAPGNDRLYSGKTWWATPDLDAWLLHSWPSPRQDGAVTTKVTADALDGVPTLSQPPPHGVPVLFTPGWPGDRASAPAWHGGGGGTRIS